MDRLKSLNRQTIKKGEWVSFYILPALKKKDFQQNEIDQLMIENPR